MSIVDVRCHCRAFGFGEVKAFRDKSGLWWARARRNGRACWIEASGSTRRNALHHLQDACRREAGKGGV
jgi:hypothetical protein